MSLSSRAIQKATFQNILLLLAAGASSLALGVSLLTMSLVLTWRYGAMPGVEARATAAVFGFALVGSLLLTAGGLLFQLRVVLALSARGWLPFR